VLVHTVHSSVMVYLFKKITLISQLPLEYNGQILVVKIRDRSHLWKLKKGGILK